MWICVNMQNVSLFHLFILKVQSILESHYQTGYTHFWLCSFKKFPSLFNLLEFVPASKKSVNSIYSSLRDTVSFRVQIPDWPNPFLTMPNINIFDQLLILWNCTKMQKMKLFHRFVWRNCWFKNPAIWLAESFLAYKRFSF